MGELVPRAPRQEFVAPVDLAYHDREDRFQGVSVNLSTTGMLVRSTDRIPRGTQVHFGFSRFRGSGEIVWSSDGNRDGALLGMKFLSIGPAGKQEETGGRGFEGSASKTHRANARGMDPDRELDFAYVTNRLLASGVTLLEIAHAVGDSVASIRRARLDPSQAGYLAPPDDWRSRMASLARGRGDSLDRMAHRLDAAGPSRQA